jgi:hypothetical protein
MLVLSDDELKEVFSLFSSSTTYELNQIYDSNNDHYFMLENLNEQYELVIDKKEFALGSLRAVLYYLLTHGYEVKKGKHKLDIEEIKETFF